ncbi:hypothetical protein ABE096_12680 [Robertmurraya massiliosenegalensis]|uniref:hypothetical protein n=1 Tax=Robertmurraya TaxID=2837507 RepID=UPI0039A5DB99
MHKLTNQIFVYIGLFAAIIMGALFLETMPYYIAMLIIMVIIGLISMSVRNMYSFALLITFILIIAFYNVGISWFMQWDMKQQGMNIGVQALFSFGSLMAWMSGYAIQRNQEVLHSLNTELALLRKYEEHAGVLTFNEFIEQAQILYTGMKRRKENGFLVYMTIREKVAFKQRILREKLTKALLASIRIKFDLVGQIHPKKMIIFLNNTNEQGLQIVINRIKEKLQKEELSENMFEFKIESLPATWDDAVGQIRSQQKEGETP